MLLDIEPIQDPTHGDIAWRVELMNHALGFLEDGLGMIPEYRAQTYKPISVSRDHSHCIGCTNKFMENGAYGTLSSGYCSLDGRKDWLCKDCYRILMAIKAGDVVPKLKPKSDTDA